MNALEIVKDVIENKRLITEEENIQMCKEFGLVHGEWKGKTSEGKFVRGIINLTVVGETFKTKGLGYRDKLSSVSIDGKGIGVTKFFCMIALGKITITATRTQYQKWQER